MYKRVEDEILIDYFFSIYVYLVTLGNFDNMEFIQLLSFATRQQSCFNGIIINNIRVKNCNYS